MYTIIGMLFCLLLGVMISTQGIAALLWVPLGFVFGIFATAQIVLPILMGLPRAIRLVKGTDARRGIRSNPCRAPYLVGGAFCGPVRLWLSLAFSRRIPL